MGDASEHWWAVGEAIGFVLLAIVATFTSRYRKERQAYGEIDGSPITRGVGAAFMDRSVADDVRRIAESNESINKSTLRIVELAERREERYLTEKEIDRKIDLKLKGH